MSHGRSKLLKSCLGLAIILALCYAVNFSELTAALSEVTASIVIVSFAVSFLLILLSVVKWKMFLRVIGGDVSIARLYALYLVGYFVNIIVPSYVGGDVVRSWYAGRNVGQHEAATATVLERYTGLVAMLALAVIFVWIVEAVTIEVKVAVVLVTAGVAVATLCVMGAERVPLLGSLLRRPGIESHARKVRDGLLLVIRNRSVLVATLGLSLFFHMVTVLNVLIAAWAVGWDTPPAFDLFVVLPLVLLIGSLPISPSGLGIQEGAFVYFLTGLGATPAQALGVGVFLRAKTYILALLGGVLWLRLKGRTDERVSEAID